MFGKDFLKRHLPAEPVSIPFNAAVMTMANRLCPKGWDVMDLAPNSLHALTLHVRCTGKVAVWSGASDNTIFSCPEHNWAFRAWHDATHYQLQQDFSFAGEANTAFAQCADLLDQYGLDEDTREFCAIILCEVIGQSAYFHLHGELVPDQRKFYAENIKAYRFLANRVIDEAYREAPGNRLAFLALARRMYGVG
ncbi:hypothetical protein CPT_Percy6 [Caulobacter phage Percy]|uniref:Uncharacterized protein n=1 Tax=Caulobacter phage Percy TaxID=1701809 RepID=A0A0M4R437_9CAUD|nr:hypothetical protein CPT_Percy6 [Caulobacter phage Percy]ALF01640.1 hypothetical protein CPT_Percy6 [Caulobacter phage Percy]